MATVFFNRRETTEFCRAPLGSSEIVTPSRDSQLPRVAKDIQPSGPESEKNVQRKTLSIRARTEHAPGRQSEKHTPLPWRGHLAGGYDRGMDERDDHRTTPRQTIIELNALREVAEATRDRLRLLIASAKQNERLLRRAMAWGGEPVQRDDSN
jgi:hypothetical protein